jgi:hypothetical protein
MHDLLYKNGSYFSEYCHFFSFPFTWVLRILLKQDRDHKTLLDISISNPKLVLN